MSDGVVGWLTSQVEVPPVQVVDRKDWTITASPVECPSSLDMERSSTWVLQSR